MSWNYNPSQYEERDFAPLPAGDYRVRIEEVIEKTFRSGNQGLEITLAVSGDNRKLWHYIVFMPDNPGMTNQKLGELFKAFKIENQDVSQMHTWLGKVGACKVRVQDDRASIHYFLSEDKAKDLPPWEEPSNGMFADSNVSTQGQFIPDNSDIPW